MKLDNVKQVAVIGTGAIGTSLAVLFTGHGYDTVIYARKEESENSSRELYRKYYKQLEEHGLVTGGQAKICEGHLSYVRDYKDLCKADFVFECAVEDLNVKYSIYKQLDECLEDPKAIISTTSALSVEDLMKGAGKFADRIIVAHPFLPPHLVPFFEVVKSDDTKEGVTEDAVAFLESADREVVVLKKNAPGFLANRLQHALFREAIHIVEQGIADPRDVDKAAKYSFMPRYTSIGLFEHMDNSGIDLNYNVENYLFGDLSSADKAPKLICDLMEKGDLGVKTGRGIYDWSDVDMNDFRERISAPYLSFFNWELPKE